MKQYQIVGVQFPGESGITREAVDQIMKQVSGYYFDFIRIEENNTAAYFVIDSDVYLELECNGLIKEFDDFVRNIIGDMANENAEGVYEFKDYPFLLQYA